MNCKIQSYLYLIILNIIFFNSINSFEKNNLNEIIIIKKKLQKKNDKFPGLNEIIEKKIFELITYIPQYYCTAADSKFYIPLKNLIGSIHKTNFDHLNEIAVYDLGLSNAQINDLSNMEKVKVYKIETTNSDLLTLFKTDKYGRLVKGCFAWKPVVIKQALEKFPYILWIDAGSTILKDLNFLFEYIEENGYFLQYNPVGLNYNVDNRITKIVLDNIVSKLTIENQKKILDPSQIMIDAGMQGLSRKLLRNYVIPMYVFSKNIELFKDDGTAKFGFGQARHDQTLFTILALNLNLEIHPLGWFQLRTKSGDHRLHIQWTKKDLVPESIIFRGPRRYEADYYRDREMKFIKYKK